MLCSCCWSPCSFSCWSVSRVTGSRSTAISAEMIAVVSSPDARPAIDSGEPAVELSEAADVDIARPLHQQPAAGQRERLGDRQRPHRRAVAVVQLDLRAPARRGCGEAQALAGCAQALLDP